jgi:hypothetical protein
MMDGFLGILTAGEIKDQDHMHPDSDHAVPRAVQARIDG